MNKSRLQVTISVFSFLIRHQVDNMGWWCSGLVLGPWPQGCGFESRLVQHLTRGGYNGKCRSATTVYKLKGQFTIAKATHSSENYTLRGGCSYHIHNGCDMWDIIKDQPYCRLVCQVQCGMCMRNASDWRG